jgi:hypothetical protein
VLELVAVRVHRRDVVSVETLDDQPFFRCQSGVQQPHLVHNFGYRKLRSNQMDLIAGAPDVGEDLVDHVDQLLAAVDDAGDALPLPRIQIAEHTFTKDLRMRNDRGKRSSEVVRDVGQELRLERIARLQLVDSPLCFLALRFKSREPLAQTCGIGAFGHAHIVVAATSVANASESTASSNC